MKIFRFLFYGTLLTVFPVVLTAQENKGPLRLSLKQAQEYAVQNNRTVKSANIDIEIAKKKVWETTAMGLPQFTATGDYQHVFNPPVFAFPSTGFTEKPIAGADNIPGFIQQNFNGINQYIYMDPNSGEPITPPDNTTFNFTVSQLIFSGEYIVGLQAARVYKELSQKSYAKSEVTTKESVASSYSILLVLDENIKVLKESVKTIDQSLTEVSGMNQQGFVEETDVDQLKINRANVQTMINSMEGQKNVATKLFQIQLGVNFDQPVELTDSIPAMVAEGNLQYLSNSNFNIENSIDYEMMKTQEGLSLLSLRRQKSTLLPTVSGFYRHTELLNEPVLNFQPKDIIGVSVTFPIFTSGQRISRINQAKLDLEKTRLSKENVGQSLIMEFESARNDYETAFRNFTSNKESMELSSKIYNRTLIKYREGVSSSLELTQTQGQYLTSQSNYFNSVLSLLNAKAKLDRILTNYQN